MKCSATASTVSPCVARCCRDPTLELNTWCTMLRLCTVFTSTHGRLLPACHALTMNAGALVGVYCLIGMDFCRSLSVPASVWSTSGEHGVTGDLVAGEEAPHTMQRITVHMTASLHFNARTSRNVHLVLVLGPSSAGSADRMITMHWLFSTQLA